MSKNQPLNDQLAYMYALERFGVRMGLEVMQRLLKALGNPEREFKSIHITGTNGKGSTAAFLDSVLRQSGLKVGLYTSPHLQRFNERICIGGVEVTDEELRGAVSHIRSVMEAETINATFFEFTTAIAFYLFAQAKVDIAVIEAGMGAKLDATNVIDPLVAIITNIGTDHMPALGRSVQEIAANKAGIIKPKGVVVTAEERPELLEYFQTVANGKNAQLHVMQKEVDISTIQSSLHGQSFHLEGVLSGDFTIPLLGRHQITNAVTALLTLHLLKEKGMEISLEEMQQGLEQTRWPGRLDIVSTKPFILVDGAHNDEGMKSLLDFLETTQLPTKKVLVLALKKGKDIDRICQQLVPLFETVIITKGTFEPEETNVIASSVKKITDHVQEIPDAKQAVEAGKKLLGEEDMMLVTGSLYMIGAALG